MSLISIFSFFSLNQHQGEKKNDFLFLFFNVKLYQKNLPIFNTGKLFYWWYCLLQKKQCPSFAKRKKCLLLLFQIVLLNRELRLLQSMLCLSRYLISPSVQPWFLSALFLEFSMLLFTCRGKANSEALLESEVFLLLWVRFGTAPKISVTILLEFSEIPAHAQANGNRSWSFFRLIKIWTASSSLEYSLESFRRLSE